VIAVPPEIREILAGLRSAGFQACPVGGCVRDSLLGRTPGDWDVCTSARPEEVIALFGEARTVPTGLRHGTVTVLLRGGRAEVTTFRSDGEYSDHRRPDGVSFVSSLSEDLARRDFTVNAMALNADGSIADPFGGRSDLTAGLIRAVGDPETRFREDALRILRALRFAARLDFRIEPETGTAMRTCRALLHSLSAERVWSELQGFLSAAAPGRLAVEYAPVLAEVLPGCTADTIRSGAEGLDSAPPDAALRIAILCRDLTPSALNKLLQSLRPDGNTKKSCLSFHQALTRPLPAERAELLPLIRSLGWDGCKKLAVLPGNEVFAALLRSVLEDGLPASVRELPVSGDDLLALGAGNGPLIGETLEDLLSAVWQGETAADRDSLLARAEKRLRCFIDSCGAVVFRETSAGPEVLMIFHRLGWGFPKGHRQAGESEARCAEREVLEETGIRISADSRFRRETVSERRGDRRKVIFLLGRYVSGEARPQPGETRAAAWFPAETAADRVYYPGDREIYLAAWDYYRKER